MRTNHFDPPGYYNGCGRMPPTDPFLRYWEDKPEKKLTPVKFKAPFHKARKPIRHEILAPLSSPASPQYKGLRRAKES